MNYLLQGLVAHHAIRMLQTSSYFDRMKSVNIFVLSFTVEYAVWHVFVIKHVEEILNVACFFL